MHLLLNSSKDIELWREMNLNYFNFVVIVQSYALWVHKKTRTTNSITVNYPLSSSYFFYIQTVEGEVDLSNPFALVLLQP